MDIHSNSCTSLYDRVCARWSRSHLQLAKSHGQYYTVDDNVADDLLVEVGRLVLELEAPLQDVRTFLSHCVSGLLVEERDLKNIIGDLVSLSEELTPSSLAEVVVRMLFLGVSPLFDVRVDAVNDTFIARLLSPEAVRVTRFLKNDGVLNRVHRHRTGKKGPSAITEKRSYHNVTEFFRCLERQLCNEIVSIANNASIPCTVAVDSLLSSERDYEWYADKAPEYLTAGVASMLEYLSAYRNELEDNIGTSSSFRITASSKQERVISCLRFIDNHDPDLVPWIVTTRLLPRLGDEVSDFFGQFKTDLDKKIPNASMISFTFPSASLRDNDAALHLHFKDLYGSDPTSNVSRLRRFLKRSTWKRWTGGYSMRTSSLSSAATFSHESSVLEVPVSLFNLTMLRDRWLRDLSLARVGPRVLEPLFLGTLSRDLKATNFFNCVLTRTAASGRFSRGRHFADVAGPFVVRGARSEHDDRQLDVEELAAFYVSLQAYRARVGDAIAIPESLLNSESIFLLYYVYNNCFTGPNRNAGDNLNGVAGYGVNHQPSFDSRRHRVDSVAAMFGRFLPEECRTISNLSACEVEIDDEF
ncbi:hypothetical protein HPB51_005701 [Rhipicephalus microplus]|uniref:Uncharacterized protein n=1 Tax=Rhipicephalus microplus TaxID=6941 RepID=A0A9J6EM77_RHIMP|nr:hypothetical protein HPB51_005701 [Rhipicephalus microplus]